MKINLLTLAVGACLAAVPSTSMAQKNQENPILAEYSTPYGIPPFDQIKPSDYMPALKAAIASQQAAVKAIVENPDAPTFDNTILALEASGDPVSNVVLLFSALEEANSSPEIIAIAEEFNPLVSQNSDEISMNNALFQLSLIHI